MSKQVTKSKAKRLKLSRNSLYYWRKRIEGVERRRNKPGVFREIRFCNILENGGMMSIHYPNGVEFRISEGFDSEYTEA